MSVLDLKVIKIYRVAGRIFEKKFADGTSYNYQVFKSPFSVDTWSATLKLQNGDGPEESYNIDFKLGEKRSSTVMIHDMEFVFEFV